MPHTHKMLSKAAAQIHLQKITRPRKSHGIIIFNFFVLPSTAGLVV
ncbi:hypothetical protein M3J09_007460 [Ascochyta lentis]